MKPFLAALLPLLLGGCATYVSGDLRNTASLALPRCNATPPATQLDVHFQSGKDWGEPNVSLFLSSLTLGVLPTYWYQPVQVRVDLLSDGELVRSDRYRSGIHYFYGWAWVPFMHPEDRNRIPFSMRDTGQAFAERAIRQTLVREGHDGDEIPACRLTAK